MATPLTAIPDHLLADILLRLPAPEDLARASAARASFRGLVTDASFLRRFRRLHPAPLLGFLDRDGFNPSVSAPGALALARAADFSFAFLPTHSRWTVRDTRDGRVLLDADGPGGFIRDLLVCDPLHRRYILLPPPELPPHHLIIAASGTKCKPFLLPRDDDDDDDDDAFRVICMLHCDVHLSALLFSSTTGQWTLAASKAWGDLVRGGGDAETPDDVLSQMNRPFFLRHHYAYGRFYWDWLALGSNRLLVLDTRRMEFSMAVLPPGGWSTRGLAIVEAGEGRLGIFGFHAETASHLRYTIQAHTSPVEKIIPLLDCGETYCIADATERYLLLGRRTQAENPLIEYFSLDVKTLKLQRVCAKQGVNVHGKRIYANFPPSLLSSPAV